MSNKVRGFSGGVGHSALGCRRLNADNLFALHQWELQDEVVLSAFRTSMRSITNKRL